MLHWILCRVTTYIHNGAFGSMLACSAITWWNYSGTWMYFAKDWSLCRRILTGYYFWILKAATWNHGQYWITFWINNVKTPWSQNCGNNFGIFILFNLLTLVVILRFSTRGIKLVLQIDVYATRIGGQQLPLIVIQLIIAMPIFSLFIISPDSTKYYPAGNMLVIFRHYSAAIFDKKTQELSYYL